MNAIFFIAENSQYLGTEAISLHIVNCLEWKMPILMTSVYHVKWRELLEYALFQTESLKIGLNFMFSRNYILLTCMRVVRGD
jgi:hypothetical protein